MKRLFMSIIATLLFLAPAGLATVPAFADSKALVCQGIGLDPNASASDCTNGTGEDGISKLVKGIIEILSIVIGIAAVIMIIIAGLRYVTSGGDSNSISGAKNTLIYALVGLAVAAIAQLVVHFVLAKIK